MRPAEHAPAPRPPSADGQENLPAKLTVRTCELPAASLDWLEERTADPERRVLWTTHRAIEALALLPGVVLVWWSVGAALNGAPWDGPRALRLGALFLATALALAFGGRRFHAAVSARLPRMKLIHSLYYIEVDHDRVHFFPLVHLHDAATVRRGPRGGSTRTNVLLPFGWRKRRVPFSHMDGAARFLQDVLRRRHLALHPPPGGAPAGASGIQLVPAVFRVRGPRPDRRPLLLAAAAVIVAGLAWNGARAAHDRREQAWARAAARTLAVAVRWSEPPPATAAPDALACPASAATQQHELARQLQLALDRSLGAGTLRVVSSPEPGAATLELEVTARAAGRYRAPAGAVPSVRAASLDFTGVLRPPAAPARQLRGHAPPPAELVLPPDWRERPAPESACEALRAAHLASLAVRVAGALALAPGAKEPGP